MSIISFDNVPESITFPIDTIDFGFTALGFQAAHILIGDIPFPGKARIIEAAPRLIERGSIAAPGPAIPTDLLCL